MSGQSRENLILFIHGFTGNQKTWDREDVNKSIKQILQEDFDIVNNFDMELFTYPTNFSNIPFLIKYFLYNVAGQRLEYKKNLPIDIIASQLDTKLSTTYERYKNIILISHSMGGLVAKQCILENISNGKNCKHIKYISLAVPHDGALIANFGNKFFKKNKHLKQLKFQNSFVTRLNIEWMRNSNAVPETWCFVANFDQVVTNVEWQKIKNLKMDHILNLQCDHSTILTPSVDSPTIFKIKQICKTLIPQPVSTKGITSIKETHQKESQIGRRFYLDIVEKANFALRSDVKMTIKITKPYRRRFLHNEAETTYSLFLEKLKSKDLIVFSAKGGMGKSVLIQNIINDLFDNRDKKIILFFNNKKKWEESHMPGIARNNSMEVRFTNLLLGFRSSLSFEDLKNSDLIKKSTIYQKYIFVDAINEIPGESNRKEILETLYAINRNYGFKIIITTRYYNPSFYAEWDHFKLEKIQMTTVKENLKDKYGSDFQIVDEKTEDYLQIPFFLNIAIINDNPLIKIEGYADYIREHTLKNIERQTQIINELSELSYRTYILDNRTAFHKNDLTAEQIEYYCEKGILIDDEESLKFEHDLILEYFVSNFFSKDEQLWNRDNFDKMVLDHRQSFEIIQMTLEQLDSKESGERFLTAVYNWNFNAVLHCFRWVEDKYPVVFARVILLTISEKIFDRFIHTKKRVTKYLKTLVEKFEIHGLPMNLEDYVNLNPTIEKNLSDFNRVINQNKSHFNSSGYEDWFKVFSYSESSVSDEMYGYLTDDNALVGWTCSNVLKRKIFSDSDEKKLIKLYGQQTDSLKKWRIVHALGNAESNESIEFLFNVLANQDEYSWAKFGAIRSLMEIAMFKMPVKDVKPFLARTLNILSENDGIVKTIIDEFRTCLTNEVPADRFDLFDIFDQITTPYNKLISNNSEKINWEKAKKEYYENNKIRARKLD